MVIFKLTKFIIAKIYYASLFGWAKKPSCFILYRNLISSILIHFLPIIPEALYLFRKLQFYTSARALFILARIRTFL